MKYRVLRDKGYPVDAPRHAFGEVFASHHVEDEHAVASGYIEKIEEPKTKPAKPEPVKPAEPDPHD